MRKPEGRHLGADDTHADVDRHAQDHDDDVNKGEERSIDVDSETYDGRDKTKQQLVTVLPDLENVLEFTVVRDLECP